MKITINYDLIDKVAEANQGYSLKRCFKRTLALTSISSAIGIQNNIKNQTLPYFLYELAIYILVHSTYTAGLALSFKNITIENASIELSDLITELHKLNIRTTESDILDTYSYKTTYGIDLSTLLPQIKQKKYINVPVRDEYWGDKEISLLQEHIPS